MPELDTLRGIAVLGVVFLHGFYWEYGTRGFHGAARAWMLATSGGWLGVNLFFVLSGFLITGTLLESRSEPHYYRRFYTRRALRILPAYYALLLILAVLHQASAAFLGLSFIYLANVTGFFGVVMDYGPLWSLAVEEHYYILWPAIVRKLRVRQLVSILVLICITVPVLRAVTFHYGHTAGLPFYTWFVADGLAFGSLAAILLRTPITRKQVFVLCAFLLGSVTVVAIAGAPFGILTRQRLLGAAFQYTLANIFFLGTLLLVLILGTGPQKRWVNGRLLQFFGYISYGLYLVHLVMFRIYDEVVGRYRPQLQPSAGHLSLVIVRFLFAAGAAILVAYLSRKYYENRFLRLKARLAPQHSEIGSKDSPVIPLVQGPPREITLAHADRTQSRPA